MAEKKIKVICADIDSTLTYGFGPVSDTNRKAIEDLMDAGILFGLGSGRSYEDLSTYPEQWQMSRPFDFYVGLNGASLYDGSTGENVIYAQIPKEYVKRLILEADNYDLGTHVYAHGVTYFSRFEERLKTISKNKLRQIVIADDLSQMYEVDTPKVLINVPDERMEEISEHFKPILEDMGNTVKLIRTSPGAMEFVPSTVNKFYSLKIYCDRHGIPMEEVAAFGDTTNDNEMIEGAGLGVCMANGTDDTKALADVITEYPAWEDGFAKYVYEYLL